MDVIDVDVTESRGEQVDPASWIDRCDRLVVTWSAAGPVTTIHDATTRRSLLEIRETTPCVTADREGLSGMPVTWSIVPVSGEGGTPMLQGAPDLFGNRMEVLGPYGRTIASVVWTPRFLVRRHAIYSGRDRANRLIVRSRFGLPWRLAITGGDDQTIGTIGRLHPAGKRVSRRRRKIPVGPYDHLERLEINVKRGRLTPALRWGLIAYAVLVARTGERYGVLSRLLGR